MPYPVSELIPSLLDALSFHPVVLLNAPTGAGKSTWLPLQLLSAPVIKGKILLLEPRRLAARNVAFRLAQQLGEPTGETIGYRMRAESRISPRTRLEVMTEGVLTRQLQVDPSLEGVGLVILDEFHERSLQSDLALALLRDVQEGWREDLKVLIMSATLDDKRLGRRFPAAPLLTSAGRSYPVDRQYRPLPAHLPQMEAIADTVCQLLRQASGSLLLFLPGVAEIQRVMALLQQRLQPDLPQRDRSQQGGEETIELCPLYGALPLEKQQRAIQPAAVGKRKVVLATNIAESSLTIEGIRLVVDSALERWAYFDLRTGLTRLLTQRISKASMAQRAGRAGRLQAGICWHLLAKEQAERASEQTEAEILHSDLSLTLLELLQWGCQKVDGFFWLDPLPATAVAAAQKLLRDLGALQSNGQLSEQGHKMATLGCDPRLAAMIMAGAVQGTEAVTTAAHLAAIIEDPPRGGECDITYWLRFPQPLWQRRAQQLIQRVGMVQGSVAAELAPLLLAVAFPDRIARNRSGAEVGRFQLANGLGAWLDGEQSLSHVQWLVAAQLLQGVNRPDARILLAAELDLQQLQQQSPHLVEQKNIAQWDADKATLRTWRRWQIGELMIKAELADKPTEQEWQQALLAWIRQEGLQKLPWSETARQLQQRLYCAGQWLPEETWPAADEATLLATLEEWLLPELQGVHSLRGLQQMDLFRALERRLDWQQKQRLDSALPTYYTVPSGSRLPVYYHSEKAPVLAVKLQEVFGEKQTPLLAEGRVALVLHLLSPAGRPLQVTADLAAFWNGAYKEVQKEMKGRYPRHHWPDNPQQAVPTRRTTRSRK